MAAKSRAVAPRLLGAIRVSPHCSMCYGQKGMVYTAPSRPGCLLAIVLEHWLSWLSLPRLLVVERVKTFPTVHALTDFNL